MNCPHCAATSTRERTKKTKLGYATFFCPNCQHIFNERTGTPFHALEFPTDVVLLAVLWRLRYKLSLRDVADMFLARVLHSHMKRSESGKHDLLLSLPNNCGQNAGDKQEPPGMEMRPT